MPLHKVFPHTLPPPVYQSNKKQSNGHYLGQCYKYYITPDQVYYIRPLFLSGKLCGIHFWSSRTATEAYYSLFESVKKGTVEF